MSAREPPSGDYHFLLEVSGVPAGSFRSLEVRPPPPGATRPGSAAPPFQRTVRPPDTPLSPPDLEARRIPEGLKWHDITLERGQTRIPALDGSDKDPGFISLDIRPKARASIPGRLEGSVPSAETTTGRSRLDGVALKWRPAMLVLVGFVPSGRSIPEPDRRHSGRIVLKDPNGASVARWSFQQGWPCKWYVPELDRTTSVGLMVEGLRRG